MSKVQESEALNKLHEALAKVLVEQVEGRAEYTDDNGETQSVSTASPAMLAVAAKFLKDNNVTCSVEEDSNLGRLEDILLEKQKKGRAVLAEVTAIDAAKAQEN